MLLDKKVGIRLGCILISVFFTMRFYLNAFPFEKGDLIFLNEPCFDWTKV